MRILIASICCFLLFGCVSQVVSMDKHIDSFIGEDFSIIKGIYSKPSPQKSGFFKSATYSWNEKILPFTNGNKIYKYSNPYLDCEVNWEVNMSGKIIGGSYKGDDCG